MSDPKGWPVEATEDLLRATLPAATLRGMKGRTTNPTGLPDLIVEEIVGGGMSPSSGWRFGRC
jgi:hypothetical protein